MSASEDQHESKDLINFKLSERADGKRSLSIEFSDEMTRFERLSLMHQAIQSLSIGATQEADFMREHLEGPGCDD